MNKAGGKISKTEIRPLLDRAVELNDSSTSSHRTKNLKGNHDLNEVMDEHRADFSDEALIAMSKFLRMQKPVPYTNTGTSAPMPPQSPANMGGGMSSHTPGLSPGHRYPGSFEINPAAPGRVSTPAHPGDMAGRVGGHGAPSTPPRPAHPGSTGGPSSTPPRAGGAAAGGTTTTPPSTSPTTGGVTPTAEMNGPLVGTRGPRGLCTMDWHAKKSTYKNFWWPRQERVQPGGDPNANLYAIGGPLDIHDQCTGKSARKFEYDHFREPFDAVGVAWHGWCNNAAEAGCFLKEPKRAVMRNGIKISTRAIQGYLVKMTPSFVKRVEFVGKRNNGSPSDNPNDPPPSLLISTFKKWAALGLPFNLDIAKGKEVWNYCFDQGQIWESDTPPAGFNGDVGAGPGTKTVYYSIPMEGTGLPEEARDFRCYITTDANGNIVKEGYMEGVGGTENCDFMWLPIPIDNIMSKEAWVMTENSSNPHLDGGWIYDVYMESIA